LTAPLTRSASFVFRNLKATKPESYLLDIRSAEYVFAPYRVDISADGTVLGMWETYRGNPWDNRGPEKFVVDAAAGNGAKASEVTVEAKVLARRGFYEERARCEMHSNSRAAGVENSLPLRAPNNVYADKMRRASLASFALQKPYDLVGFGSTGLHLRDAETYGE
jgi:hypothetical protein